MKVIASFFVLTLLFCFSAYGNDGSYTMSGNHLIPISDKNIQVKKEILTIKRNDRGVIEVSVYYEFHNNGPEKEIIVGFEAFPTFNTDLQYSKDGAHPYMKDFSVHVNGSYLPYQVSLVDDTLYKTRERGVINAVNFDKVRTQFEKRERDYFEFTYVYHFNALFKKGLNSIQHNYEYQPGDLVGHHYHFDYILDAAARWGNGVIEDFTLIIDVGPYQQFGIKKSFFEGIDEWKLIGKGNLTKNYKTHTVENDHEIGVRIERGMLIYQKKNFKPMDNLFVSSVEYVNDWDLLHLPYNQDVKYASYQGDGALERKIIYNLPFARRGYVFKNEEIQKFYNSMDWYQPNPNYVPDVEQISPKEKEWLTNYK